jgi:enoyl-CoA hydratase
VGIFAPLISSNRKRDNAMNYEMILTSVTDRVAVITLNRPKALNALNDQMMDELGNALLTFDADDKISCIVITGSEKAFAAGADIAAMAKLQFQDVYKGDYITKNWETIRRVRKPVLLWVAAASWP